MVTIVVLGSSCLVATETRRPTHLACLGADRGLLIDCGVSPRGRLEHLGFDPDRIGDVFITHYHPDHAAGLPLFLMELSLRGRRAPMRLHGGGATVRRIRKAMLMYGWRKLPDSFPVSYRPVKRGKNAAVLENAEFAVRSTPVRHVVPTLAVRVDVRAAGKSFVYSADTEPCAELAELARDADLLIHEATGEGPGHSSAAQAGAVAKDARAGRLLLIHTDPYADADELAAQAGAVFAGEVAVAADNLEIRW